MTSASLAGRSIERFQESIRHRLTSYWASKSNVTVHNLGRHAMSLGKLQRRSINSSLTFHKKNMETNVEAVELATVTQKYKAKTIFWARKDISLETDIIHNAPKAYFDFWKWEMTYALVKRLDSKQILTKVHRLLFLITNLTLQTKCF